MFKTSLKSDIPNKNYPALITDFHSNTTQLKVNSIMVMSQAMDSMMLFSKLQQ